MPNATPQQISPPAVVRQVDAADTSPHVPAIRHAQSSWTDGIRLPKARWQGATPCNDAGSPLAKQLITGRNATGEITVYGQLHDRSELDLHDRLGVADFQTKLLIQLLHDRPRYVFVESLDCSPEDLKWDRIASVQQTSKIFPNGFDPLHMTGQQRLYLATAGAKRVYQCLCPEVQVLPTSRRSERSVIEHADTLEHGSPEREKIIMAGREKLTMTLICNFLKSHPGEHVALIYGAGHVWDVSDFPDQEHYPSVNLVSWSNLTTPTDVALSLKRRSTDEIREIIQREKILVPLCCIYINDKKLKREALAKSIVDITRYENAEAVASDLKSYLPDLSVVIDELAAEKKGPFASFVPNADRIENFKRLTKLADQSQAILAEIDPATQSEMVNAAHTIEAFVIPSLLDYRAACVAIEKIDITRLCAECREQRKNPTTELRHLLGVGITSDPYQPHSPTQSKASTKFSGRAWEMQRDSLGPFAELEEVEKQIEKQDEELFK